MRTSNVGASTDVLAFPPIHKDTGVAGLDQVDDPVYEDEDEYDEESPTLQTRKSVVELHIDITLRRAATRGMMTDASLHGFCVPPH